MSLRLAILFLLGLTANAAEISHRFLAADFMHGTLHHVDQRDPSQSWTIPVPAVIFDLLLIGQGRLLIPGGSGYQILDLNTRTVVETFKHPDLSGVITGAVLPGGRILLGCNRKQDGREMIRIVAKDGNRLTTVTDFPDLRWLRTMRPAGKDTWLLAEWDGATEVSLEPGAEPRVIRRFTMPRPRNAYQALRLGDGTTLVAGGYAAALFSYGQDGQLTGSWVAPQPEGLSNHFYGGVQMLPNGNRVVANWTGHSAKDFKPGLKLIECDPAGQVVWSWNPAVDQVGTINQFIILDQLDTRMAAQEVGGVLSNR